jgi:hypothetical protein
VSPPAAAAAATLVVAACLPKLAVVLSVEYEVVGAAETAGAELAGGEGVWIGA